MKPQPAKSEGLRPGDIADHDRTAATNSSVSEVFIQPLVYITNKVNRNLIKHLHPVSNLLRYIGVTESQEFGR